MWGNLWLNPAVRRTYSVNARCQPRRENRGGFTFPALFLLIVLAFVPALAWFKLAASSAEVLVFGYLGVIFVLTVSLYGHDKKQAKVGGQRIAEANLHLLELVGGWPAAFVAQRLFRHKTAKRGYQCIFWMIVALHEALSFDFLSDWQYVQAAIAYLRGPIF